MSQSSTSTATLEFTRAVCTCGKELSDFYYLLTAKNHFEKFKDSVGLIQKDADNIGFRDKSELDVLAEKHGLNFCCLVNLRYGIREPIAIMPLPDQESRKYPEGLPGPLSKEKILSWY